MKLHQDIESIRHKAINSIRAASHLDTETRHFECDQALVQFLKDVGEIWLAQEYEDVREKRGFWYA